MPYNRWGAKSCALCSDPWLSRTGVCIGCDAGMCRTFFHVTWYASNIDTKFSTIFSTMNCFITEVLNEKDCCQKHSTKILFKPILFMPIVNYTLKRVQLGKKPFIFFSLAILNTTSCFWNSIYWKRLGGGNQITCHTSVICNGGLVKETPVTIWWIRVTVKMCRCVVFCVNWIDKESSFTLSIGPEPPGVSFTSNFHQFIHSFTCLIAVPVPRWLICKVIVIIFLESSKGSLGLSKLFRLLSLCTDFTLASSSSLFLLTNF